MMCYFSKLELEISPFLTVEEFYRNVKENRVGGSLQKISTQPTFGNALTIGTS